MRTTHHIGLGSLVLLLLLSMACADPSRSVANLRAEGLIHGRVRLLDVETGRVSALDRGCRIEVVTAHQRVVGSTREGATYRIRVPEQGMWPLNLYYKDKVLTTEVGSTPQSNEVNLFVEVFQGQYKLRAEWVDPNPDRVR